MKFETRILHADWYTDREANVAEITRYAEQLGPVRVVNDEQRIGHLNAQMTMLAMEPIEPDVDWILTTTDDVGFPCEASHWAGQVQRAVARVHAQPRVAAVGLSNGRKSNLDAAIRAGTPWVVGDDPWDFALLWRAAWVPRMCEWVEKNVHPTYKWGDRATSSWMKVKGLECWIATAPSLATHVKMDGPTNTARHCEGHGAIVEGEWGDWQSEATPPRAAGTPNYYKIWEQEQGLVGWQKS